MEAKADTGRTPNADPLEPLQATRLVDTIPTRAWSAGPDSSADFLQSVLAGIHRHHPGTSSGLELQKFNLC